VNREMQEPPSHFAGGPDKVEALLGFQAAQAAFREQLAALRRDALAVSDLLRLVKAGAGEAAPVAFDLEVKQDAEAASAALAVDPGLKTRLRAASDQQVFFATYFGAVLALLGEIFAERDIEVSKLALSARLALLKKDGLPRDVARTVFELYGDFSAEKTEDERKAAAKPVLAPVVRKLVDRFESKGFSEEDIVTFCGVLSIQMLGGSKVAWRPGREDAWMYSDARCFSFQERELLKATLRDPRQPFDNSPFFSLVQDRANVTRRTWASIYATDPKRFEQDFSFAFTKLLEWRFKFVADVSPDAINGNDTIEAHFELPASLRLFDFRFARKAFPTTTREWKLATMTKQPTILQMVKQITRKADTVDLSAFNSMSKAAAALGFHFDLNDELDRAAAVHAESIDSNLPKFKPLMVPKKVSEAHFYENYFSRVFLLRKKLSERQDRNSQVVVGSSNPVKKNACIHGFLTAFEGHEKCFVFSQMGVPSGVSSQPIGDKETRQGALNRARICSEKNPGAFCVGIEGGLSDDEVMENLECFAWIAIISPTGEVNCTRTATFNIPPALASLCRKGIELGRADDIIHGTKNSKQRGGTVAQLTQGQIDRTAFYAHAVVLACAPFANPNLHI